MNRSEQNNIVAPFTKTNKQRLSFINLNATRLSDVVVKFNLWRIVCAIKLNVLKVW